MCKCLQDMEEVLEFTDIIKPGADFRNITVRTFPAEISLDKHKLRERLKKCSWVYLGLNCVEVDDGVYAALQEACK